MEVCQIMKNKKYKRCLIEFGDKNIIIDEALCLA